VSGKLTASGFYAVRWLSCETSSGDCNFVSDPSSSYTWHSSILELPGGGGKGDWGVFEEIFEWPQPWKLREGEAESFAEQDLSGS